MQTPAPTPAAPRRSFASRLFGYDVFVSFALGPPPRGSQSYASDLARRLRERDFSVFFSEDEAPPGDVLDASLRGALKASKMLVVVANRGTLAAPRWIRTEVEEYRRMHPARPIVPISVDGALQDPQLSDTAESWLRFRDRIWLDESAAAAEQGIASDALVERLATAPTRQRSNVAWRRVVRGTIVLLAGLVVLLGIATKAAFDSAEQARAELRRAVGQKLTAEATQRLARQRAGGDERALLELAAAARIAPGPASDGGLLAALVQRDALLRLVDAGEPATALAYAPDGRSLAFGSGRGTLQLRDAETLQPVGPPLGHHEGGIVRLAWCGDGRRLVTGSTRSTARVWNVRGGPTEGATLAGHRGWVVELACSPDASRVASVDGDAKLRLWDADSGAPIDNALSRTSGNVVRVAWQPGGARIVTGTVEGMLRWWDAASGEPIGEPIRAHGGPVGALAFSRDGTRLVTAGLDHLLRLWDGASGAPLGEPSKVQPRMAGLAANADGSRIAVAYADATLRVVDTATWAATSAALRGHQDVPMTIDLRPDGLQIATAGAGDRSIRLWDARAGRSPGAAVAGASGEVESLAFSPDGRHLAGASPLGIRVWDSATRQLEGLPYRGHDGPVKALAYSPDGRWLLSSGSDDTLRRWDTATGEPAGAPIAAGGTLGALAVSPDGGRIAARREFGIGLWNAGSGAAAGSTPDASTTSAVTDLAYSPDGTRIASTATNDKLVRLWDAATGQPAGTIDAGFESGLKHLAYNPRGGTLVAGGLDGLLRRWNLEAGKPAGSALGDPLAGLTGSIAGLDWTRDGRWIASAHGDAIRFWDAASGALVGSVPAENGWVIGPLAFSRGGDRMAFRSGGAVRLWPAPPAWAGEVCAKLARNPTRAEWRDWVSSEIPYACPCPGLPAPADDADPAPPPACGGEPARSLVH